MEALQTNLALSTGEVNLGLKGMGRALPEFQAFKGLPVWLLLAKQEEPASLTDSRFLDHLPILVLLSIQHLLSQPVLGSYFLRCLVLRSGDLYNPLPWQGY